jgi:hypothetical protein
MRVDAAHFAVTTFYHTPTRNTTHTPHNNCFAAMSHLPRTLALLAFLLLALPPSHAQLAAGPSAFVGLIGSAAPNATAPTAVRLFFWGACRALRAALARACALCHKKTLCSHLPNTQKHQQHQKNKAPVCQGKTPASLVIESVQPVPPGAGGVPSISLRNAGGQAANITGYRLAANGSAGGVLTIGSTARCRENGTLAAGEGQVWTPKSDANACGFEFALGPT